MEAREIPFSLYGHNSRRPAPVNLMTAAFAADFRDDLDINLGVGYVNEATIPRRQLQDSLGAVLSRPDKYRAALNYGGARGSENLISSLTRLLRLPPSREEIGSKREIIIGPNGATGLLESIAHILAPGIVITSDPMYYIYCNLLERLGFTVVAVPEDESGLRTDLLRSKLEDLGPRRREISFFYVVTINNPTSVILSNQRQRELVAIATRVGDEANRQIPLILDKAYEQLIHDPDVPPAESAASFDSGGIVYEIGTLSKVLAPALRIGYLVGPTGEFLDALVQRTSDAGFSAPLINQEMASHFLDHYLDDQVQRVNEGYREKSRLVRDEIEQNLGTELAECRGGQAGFYYYLTLKRTETGTESAFFHYLARTTGRPDLDDSDGQRNPRVVYIPGQYCVHPEGDMVDAGRRQLRISYGFEETERIAEALGYMREAVDFAAATNQDL